MTSTPPRSVPPPSVTVESLLAHADLSSAFSLVDGDLDVSRSLTHPRVQKSGLVLVGHMQGIVPSRVQVLGETEMSFLEALDADERRRRLDAFFALGLSLVVVTRGLSLFPELVEVARATRTPIIATEHRSSRAIGTLQGALDRLLAPETQIHGVLIDIHGVGTLLTGPSGIGKSECALFLVERGHRLVADDQVVLSRLPPSQLWGTAPELLRGHLELRGIGIVNVRDLFGAAAVRERKLVQLAVELCPWGEEGGDDYERLGLAKRTRSYLDVSLPLLRIPVRPGRDMAVILEVAARNHLLQKAGHHAARKFVDALEASLGVKGASDKKG
jgi:HPr kinase/phosphorylase